MIMNTLRRIIRQDETEEFQVFAQEVIKAEQRKIEKYKSKPIYVNPASYRLGVQIKPERKFICFDKKEYCPV
jgi:hypothetical protein